MLIAWTSLLSFLAVGIISAVIFFYYKSNSKVNRTSNSGIPNAPDIDAAFLDFEAVELPSLDGKSAKKLVSEYLESTDQSLISERFIVHSAEEAVIPALAEQKATEGAITRLRWDGQIYLNNRVHNQIVVFRKKEEKETNRIALLFKGDDDIWRIDFDAYMRTTTPSWEELLSGSSENSVVRVFISSYNYYNGIYSDDRIWQAYSIVSPDIPDFLYGYAKKDSAQNAALQKIISASSEPRVTIGLLSEDGAGERQFTISRVYAEDWALSAEAYDESF